MNIYVWDYTSPVNDSYHDGGGVLIVAPTLERARALWDGDPKALTADPDYSWPTVDTYTGPTKVIIFPDQGCC